MRMSKSSLYFGTERYLIRGVSGGETDTVRVYRT